MRRKAPTHRNNWSCRSHMAGECSWRSALASCSLLMGCQNYRNPRTWRARTSHLRSHHRPSGQSEGGEDLAPVCREVILCPVATVLRRHEIVDSEEVQYNYHLQSNTWPDQWWRSRGSSSQENETPEGTKCEQSVAHFLSENSKKMGQEGKIDLRYPRYAFYKILFISFSRGTRFF